MKNWDEAYKKQGIIQNEVIDLVSDAVKLFKSKNIKRVLDLGFGTGRHTIYLAQQGFEMYGIDISEEGKNITEKRLEDNEVIADLTIADMHKLPYKNNFFDAVIAAYVIEHNTYKGLVETITEVKRVLNPGGFFVTTLISPKDIKNGVGREIEPGTFIDSNDPIESNVPHRISEKSEVKNLFRDFKIIKLEEQARVSVRQGNKTIYRWEIIVQK